MSCVCESNIIVKIIHYGGRMDRQPARDVYTHYEDLYYIREKHFDMFKL